MKFFLLFCLLWLSAIELAYTQSAHRITFVESEADFPNPERGFYHHRILTDPADFDVRDENITLIFGRISADSFRYKPFTEEFLQKIQDGFDLVRKYGLKVNPRVTYNYGPHPGKKSRYGDDAPKETIMKHIEQLKPLWHRNKDVINVLDAGFIGGWGEWHSSAHGLDNPQDRKDILFAILEALPEDRMVVQRYPRFKREIFAGSEISGDSILSRDRAFDSSKLARVGHLNDCFLSSYNDVGTYQNLEEGWPLQRELEYIAAESPYVPYGGETCRLDERGRCENALREMELLHINYLNHDYNPEVIQRWREQGCYNEIRRRIGYRFVLRSAQLPESLEAGRTLVLELTISNVGFGELFNPRPVEIILQNNRTGAKTIIPVKEDPRFWTAGQETTIRTSLPVPADLPAGVYTLGLRLPDPAPTLYDDIRYAVRFANEEVWDAAAGMNVLSRDLRITQ
ncbi:MAG: DUF4832 domain-containing protein [Calditrichia bacterium]